MVDVSGSSLPKRERPAGGALARGKAMRPRYRWLIGLLVVSTASAAHAAGEVIAEAYFKQDPRTVSSLLANICMDRQATVVEQDEYHVLCSKQTSGMKGVLVQALMANSKSGTPGKKIRFTIGSSQYGTRVQVSQSSDIPVAFNQFGGGSDSGKARSDMQAALVQAGGSLTPPTQETAPAPVMATPSPGPANQAASPPPAMCGFSPCVPH